MLTIISAVILRLPKVFFDVNATQVRVTLLKSQCEESLLILCYALMYFIQPLDFSPLIKKMKGTDVEKYLTTALGSNDNYLLVR